MLFATKTTSSVYGRIGLSNSDASSTAVLSLDTLVASAETCSALETTSVCFATTSACLVETSVAF